jgi:hypothetical protein
MEKIPIQRVASLAGRTHGPMNARIYKQTLVAVVLAARGLL